jgi:drug/metabolite transporter (DMT)-like permease
VQALFPALFVLMWSTGFIAAKYGLPYAPPYKFLLIRFACVAALMTIVALATRAERPKSAMQVLHVAIAAWLVHACYLGGVFVAISHGMPAGTSAMLVGLQPLLTVVIARLWLDERVAPLQWLGLFLGLAGVYFVVRHKVDFSGDLAGLVPITLALVAISVGTLYQKRFCAKVDLRSSAVIQFWRLRDLYCRSCCWSRAGRRTGRRRSCSRSAGRCWCCRSARSACSIGCCATAPRQVSPAVLYGAADHRADGLG